MKTHQITRRLTVSILAAGLLLPAFASGETVLFHDDFSGDEINPGDSPSIPPWTSADDEEAFSNFLRVRQDFSDYFGKGTDNQYLEFSGNDASMLLAAENVLADGPDHEVVTFSMDFYEPDLFDKQDPLIIFIYSGPILAENRVDRLRLTHGGTGASAPAPESRVYQLDTVNRLDWILNNSEETITYLNGTRTIEPGRSDVWINGNLILGDYSFENTPPSGPIRGFDLRTFTNIPAQEMYIDEVKLVAGANVRLPEAATNPLMEFLFEGDLVNTGTLGGEGSFIHQREDDPAHNWVWQNRASLGVGLNGQPNSGLDNTQVGGMGDYGQGEVREGGFFYSGTGLRGLQSVTITSWFKTPTDTFWSSSAYMASWLNAIDYRHQDEPGQRVFLSVPLGQNNPQTRREFSGPTPQGQTPWQQFSERWTFQAVTFDGTTGTMSFYYAYEDSDGVIVDATRTGMAAGPLRLLTSDIAFGNIYSGVRPFKGHLDNVRVFGSYEDGSGALGLAALNNLWAGDLAAATDPVDPVDEIVIVDFNHDGNDFSVSFETEAGVDYVIEFTTDFSSWVTAEVRTGDGGVQTFSESVSDVLRRFYRIRLAD